VEGGWGRVGWWRGDTEIVRAISECPLYDGDVCLSVCCVVLWWWMV